MAYTKLPLLPGIHKDDTPLSAEGFFIDADKVRFVRGKPQTIGGWEAASDSAFLGVCRGLFAWRENTALSWAAAGTHVGLFAYFDALLYNITPIVSRGQLSNPFDTIETVTAVNVSHTAHGRAVGDRVRFNNAAAVGGVTINGEYSVAAVLGSDDYTIVSVNAAVSTASGGGNVDYEYLLPAGLIDGTGGAGYGTGAYGVGAFGVNSNTIYYPRTWSLDNWGQNLLACPRGGAIYEWSPTTANSNLVQNGDFASGAGWTTGTGWSIGTGVATAVAGTGSDLETTIATTPGAYFLLECDITRSAGAVTINIGSVEIVSAVATSQHIKQVFFSGASTLKFSKDASFAGTVDNVSVRQLRSAHPVPNAPLQNTVIFVAPERILVAAGTVEDSTGLFNPLHIKWTAQEDNQNWVASASNTAGYFTLAKGGRIVGAKAGRGENYVWTDDGLYVMRFVPDPNVVYSFAYVGGGCGLIGPNAAAVTATATFWLSNTGEFFRYAGGAPEPLQSTVRRHVFDNLAQVQGDKIYAFTVAAYNEAWWLYPDMREGNECSRYVAYNYVENTWACGIFERSAWVDAGASSLPLAAGLDGRLYFHEKGNSADGAALAWSLQTAAVDIGDGDNHVSIMGCIPDFEDLLGGALMTVRTRRYPNSLPEVSGAFAITAASEKIDLRAQGRQADFTFTGASAPAFMRMGALRLDLRSTNIRR